MVLTVLHGAILTVISYGAIAKHGIGIVVARVVGFGGVGAAADRILLFLCVFMHFFDPHRGLLRHESLL